MLRKNTPNISLKHCLDIGVLFRENSLTACDISASSSSRRIGFQTHLSLSKIRCPRNYLWSCEFDTPNERVLLESTSFHCELQALLHEIMALEMLQIFLKPFGNLEFLRGNRNGRMGCLVMIEGYSTYPAVFHQEWGECI